MRSINIFQCYERTALHVMNTKIIRTRASVSSTIAALILFILCGPLDCVISTVWNCESEIHQRPFQFCYLDDATKINHHWSAISLRTSGKSN